MPEIWHRGYLSRKFVVVCTTVCLVRSVWVGGDPFSAIHAGSLTSDVYIVSFFWRVYYRLLCPVCINGEINVGSYVGGAAHSMIIVVALLAHKLLLA